MRRFGYYPALVFLLLMCLAASGFFIYLSGIVIKRMGTFKSSDDSYKASIKELQNEQTIFDNNKKNDKAYEEYFARWASREGDLDETKLRAKIQKMSEELGLMVVEISPLNAVGDEAARPARRKNPMDRMFEAKPKVSVDPVAAGVPAVGLAPGMVELRVVLTGPFAPMMTWLARMETELGSLRVSQTEWLARSPEEVRLTVGLRYKMIGGIK